MGRCRYTGVLRSQTGVPAHGFRQVVSISRDIPFPLESEFPRIADPTFLCPTMTIQRSSGVKHRSSLDRVLLAYSESSSVLLSPVYRHWQRDLRAHPFAERTANLSIFLFCLEPTQRAVRSRCLVVRLRRKGKSKSIRDALSFPPLIENVCSRSWVLALVFCPCPCPCPESPFRTPNIEKMMFQLPNGDRSSRGTKLPPHRTGHSSRESAHHRYN